MSHWYITPKEAASNSLIGVFGKAEVEDAALCLIEFLNIKSQHEWSPFTFQELTDYYFLRGWNPNTILFGLMGPWWDDGGLGCIREDAGLIIHAGNSLCVSKTFVRRVSGKKESINV